MPIEKHDIAHLESEKIDVHEHFIELVKCQSPQSSQNAGSRQKHEKDKRHFKDNCADCAYSQQEGVLVHTEKRQPAVYLSSPRTVHVEFQGVTENPIKT